MEGASDPWGAGDRRNATPRFGSTLQPVFMGQQLHRRPEGQKSSFLIKIDQAKDGSHTVNVDFDLAIA